MVRERIQPRQLKRSITLHANTGKYIFNFRVNLIDELLRWGYKIKLACPYDSRLLEKIERWAEEGFSVEWVAIPYSARRRDIFGDLKSAYAICCADLRNDIHLTFTPKSNLLGLLLLGSEGRLITNISGFGIDIEKYIERTWVKILLKFLLSGSGYYLFQNTRDYELAVSIASLENKERIKLIPGSGVDLSRFTFIDTPSKKSNFTILYLGRLLIKKGIGLFIEAAINMQNKGYEGEFLIAGEVVEGNSRYVSRRRLREFEKVESRSFLGEVEDSFEVLQRSDIIVVPTEYGEGVPRVLLEACATGAIPIVSKNAGCLDVVIDKFNGVVLDSHDSEGIENAVEYLASLSPARRDSMRRNARKLIDERFNERFVIEQYLEILNAI